MTPEEIFKRVQEIVAEQFAVDPEEITNEMSYKDDLSADSIDLVEIVMCLEDEYDISAEEEEMASIKTVGDTVNFIVNKLSA
ncbi:MAG: acyl carrier protein [Oscillospiraceae bacterium]|nr:acyl carrier protein [Oscillospiraceae bacterium]